MVMMTIDLHGYRLEEAIEHAERVIGQIRLAGHEEMLRIVTGHGIIRRHLIEYLQEYDFDFAPELGNDGALIINVD